MRSLLLLGLMGLRLGATDFTITVTDEAGLPLAGAAVEATFSRSNDPRTSSMRSFEGKTGEDGAFRFQAGAEMCLFRLRADRPGHFGADADHRHGLRFPSTPHHTLTLPRETVGVPLAYKEIRLHATDGRFPPKTWIGFDLARGDLVAPWGQGKVSDLLFWNEGTQDGWTMPIEDVLTIRKDPEHIRMTDVDFAITYGAFTGLTRIRLGETGAGILRSKHYWDYAALKMPPLAPKDGYVQKVELPYQPIDSGDESARHVGYFLRLRPRVDAAGKVVTANYAKIQGQIATGYGRVAFRYYYNPVANDRRLVFDPERNLLKPTPGDNPGLYETRER